MSYKAISIATALSQIEYKQEDLRYTTTPEVSFGLRSIYRNLYFVDVNYAGGLTLAAYNISFDKNCNFKSVKFKKRRVDKDLN